MLALIVAVVAALTGVAETLHQRGQDVDIEGLSLSIGYGLPVMIGGAVVAALTAGLALARRTATP